MRDKSYIIFIICFLLFSCNKNNDNDVAIFDLENRLANLNNQINSINLDINRLDSLISNELKIFKLLADSTLTLDIKYLTANNLDSSIKKEPINLIDPEILFKQKYAISSLSVLTCTLRNIEKNKIERFYKEDIVEINNANILEQYSILEINKLKRFIKIKSINYNIEFIMYMDMDQE